MSNQNLDHLYKGLAAGKMSAIDIQSATKVGGKTYKVVANVIGVTDEVTFAAALDKALESRASLVEGSLVIKGQYASAFIKANQPVKKFDNHFSMVTAELASDSAGKLWSVKNIDGVKHVVLESSDDLEGLFQDRINSRKTVIPQSEAKAFSATARVNNGDLVKYVDSAAGVVRAGIALRMGSELVAVAAEGKQVSFAQQAVLRVVPRHSLPEKFAKAFSNTEETAQLSPDQLAKVLAYYRKAYGEERSVEMLSKIAQMAGIAMPASGLPM